MLTQCTSKNFGSALSPDSTGIKWIELVNLSVGRTVIEKQVGLVWMVSKRNNQNIVENWRPSSWNGKRTKDYIIKKESKVNINDIISN